MKKGQILVIAVLFMTVILIMTTSLFSRVANYVLLGSNSIVREQATNLAEAGVERALWQINKTTGCSPTPSCIYMTETDTSIGSTGTFSTKVTDKTPSLKTIESKGCIPNCTNPRATRTIKTDALISDTIIAFNYGVQVGTGGVSLGQSAKITGSVYSNKTGNHSISGNNGSIITGDAWAAGTIDNPPAVGTPPSASHVHENQSGSTMPTVDYQYWKDTATAGGTIDCSETPSLCNLTGSDTAIIGNKKYFGDLSLGQSKKVTMNGPVYITGNLNLGQSSQINLNNSYGSDSTVLILDGTISVDQGASVNPTNANPKGYIMLVTTSSATPAVDIGQSGVYAIIYALNGQVKLGQSSHSTAIIANQLTLNQSAELTYDQGLASTDFSSGPGGSWQIKKGTYRIQ